MTRFQFPAFALFLQFTTTCVTDRHSTCIIADDPWHPCSSSSSSSHGHMQTHLHALLCGSNSGSCTMTMSSSLSFQMEGEEEDRGGRGKVEQPQPAYVHIDVGNGSGRQAAGQQLAIHPSSRSDTFVHHNRARDGLVQFCYRENILSSSSKSCCHQQQA